MLKLPQPFVGTTKLESIRIALTQLAFSLVKLALCGVWLIRPQSTKTIRLLRLPSWHTVQAPGNDCILLVWPPCLMLVISHGRVWSRLTGLIPPTGMAIKCHQPEPPPSLRFRMMLIRLIGQSFMVTEILLHKPMTLPLMQVLL